MENKCPNCGSTNISMLAWVDCQSKDFIDFYFEDENPHYIGDSSATENKMCNDCLETYNEIE